VPGLAVPGFAPLVDECVAVEGWLVAGRAAGAFAFGALAFGAGALGLCCATATPAVRPASNNTRTNEFLRIFSLFETKFIANSWRANPFNGDFPKRSVSARAIFDSLDTWFQPRRRRRRPWGWGSDSAICGSVLAQPLAPTSLTAESNSDTVDRASQDKSPLRSGAVSLDMVCHPERSEGPVQLAGSASTAADCIGPSLRSG
jgi:hypothetical protein